LRGRTLEKKYKYSKQTDFTKEFNKSINI